RHIYPLYSSPASSALSCAPPRPTPRSTLFPYTTLFRSGIHYCDLGGNTAIVFDQLKLDDEATKRGISVIPDCGLDGDPTLRGLRSEEHTSELQSRENLVCRLLLEKKKKKRNQEESRNRR